MSPAIYGLMATACVGLGLAAIPGLKATIPGEEPEAEAPRSGGVWAWVEALGLRLGPAAVAVLGAGRRAAIERRLDLAGRPGGMTMQRYVGIQAALLAIALAFAAVVLLGHGSFLLVALVVFAAWLAPEIWLSRTGRLRQERIERDLPDFLDILAVTVRAGLGYRVALQRVAESLGGPVGDEMIVVLRQMGLGVQRREAFEALRDRNRSESLKSFVAAQLQAEELGVPLADALNDIAHDMRRVAQQSARRRAQRAAPRVSLITTTLIVPGAIILLLVSLLLGSGATESGLLGG